jgi:hypothetical protein
MKEFAEKLRKLEKEIAAEKGRFLLFALFLSEDVTDSWDILVNAPWLEADKSAGLRYMAGKIQALGTAAELQQISRIVIIGGSQPILGAIQAALNVEHGLSEISRSTLNGIRIEHAYVITSRREVSPV